ncbi:hypothetical protein N9Z54_02420 [Planctomycetota bacterium]|jgi:hypothetical protein|nr:hypothetical protein [Planctomycetota bacterium]
MRFLPSLDPTRRAILSIGLSATVVFLLLTLETKVSLSTNSNSWIVKPWSDQPSFWPFTSILVTTMNLALWTPRRAARVAEPYDEPTEPAGPSREERKQEADKQRRLGDAERRIRARSSRAQREQTPEQQ